MIEIKNLDFRYKRVPIFDKITLNFEPGNIYGLLGENGVGKTTLLKIICGLLQPQSGTVTVDGMIASDRLPQALQEIVFLNDAPEIEKNLTPEIYIQNIAPLYPNFNHDTFVNLMQEFEVDPNRKFKEMSFGQQKKSLISCALSLGTRYILLDEPTNGLDIPSKSQFRSILSRRCDENSTIIISTHQVKDVENLIDPIVILTTNDVLLSASIQEISEKLHFRYDSQQASEALFSEARPGGFLNVMKNTEGLDSEVDIEALFNTVLKNKNIIKELFNDESSSINEQ